MASKKRWWLVVLGTVIFVALLSGVLSLISKPQPQEVAIEEQTVASANCPD